MPSFSGIKVDGTWRYRPQEKQKQFHNAILNRDKNGFRDFLYGGAARGGKSLALRWEAHRNCFQYPGLRGLLIRSSFPELERSHLTLQQLPSDLPADKLTYNSQKHVATYSNGSTLEFGYGERAADFKQYLSAEYDFIMIDELTTIPFELSYLLRSRLTASRSEFIPFWACATNPGNVAHVDVRNYFVKKSIHDKDRYPQYNPDEVFFLPATVYDNKIVMARDPGELTRLQQLPMREQQKYLFGNWDIFEGQFFDEFFSDIHVIKPEKYLTYNQLLRFNNRAGMDYGNFSAVEYMARDYNGNVIVYDEWSDIKSVRTEKVKSLKKFAVDRGIISVMIEADTNMWVPDQFDAAHSSDPASEFISAGLKLVKVSKAASRATEHRGYRVACNDAVRNALHWKGDGAGKILQKPKLVIYERCVKLCETLPLLLTDDKDVEDIADQGDLDTWYDAMKMGFMPLWTPSLPKGDAPPRNMAEAAQKYIFDGIEKEFNRRYRIQKS